MTFVLRKVVHEAHCILRITSIARVMIIFLVCKLSMFFALSILKSVYIIRLFAGHSSVVLGSIFGLGPSCSLRWVFRVEPRRFEESMEMFRSGGGLCSFFLTTSLFWLPVLLVVFVMFGYLHVG